MPAVGHVRGRSAGRRCRTGSWRRTWRCRRAAAAGRGLVAGAAVGDADAGPDRQLVAVGDDRLRAARRSSVRRPGRRRPGRRRPGPRRTRRRRGGRPCPRPGRSRPGAGRPRSAAGRRSRGPRVSLTSLKSSRSISATATGRSPGAVSAVCSRWWKSTRLGSRVSASWVAPWSRRRSSRPLSRNAVIWRSTTSAVSSTARGHHDPLVVLGGPGDVDQQAVDGGDRRVRQHAERTPARPRATPRRDARAAASRWRSAAQVARKKTTGMVAMVGKQVRPARLR